METCGNRIIMMYKEKEQAKRSIKEKEEAIAKLIEEKEYYEEVYLSFNNENQGGIACSFPLYINKIAEITDKINKYQEEIKVLEELDRSISLLLLRVHQLTDE